MDFEIIDGVVDEPYCMAIYGAGGVGKSWLSSYAENPFFLSLESGTNLIPKRKFKDRARTVEDVFEAMRFKVKDPEDTKTLIIDSLGFFQSFVYVDIIKKNPEYGDKKVTSIVDYGYHSGYAMAMPYWERLIAGIDALQRIGMNVILVTHSQKKNAQTESGDSYKYEDFALNSSNNGDVCELLRRRLDICLFMESTAKTIKDKNRTKPMIGTRPDVTVYTRATSRFYAKTRALNEKDIPDHFSINPREIDKSSQLIINTVTGSNK